MLIVKLLAGMALLIFGAEILVRGASRLAGAFGVSPLIVGLTVVSFGTSSPELAVGVLAALEGAPGITIGNVVGSNIFNTLVILGLSAVIAPLVVHQQLVKLDVPLMIGACSAMFLLGLDGHHSRLDGVLLVSALAAYTAFLIRQSRRESAEVQAEYDQEFGVHDPAERRRWPMNLLLVIAGVALLALGSDWLVEGAAGIARMLGVSELVIGLTLIAAGTSLPEAATSIIAALRGERDIAVGNVIGSNLFNILGVLGVTAAVAPRGVAVAAEALRFDIPVMWVAALACYPIFVNDHRVGRGEGALFLCGYLAYVVHLLLAAVHSTSLPVLEGLMLGLAAPLTVVALVQLGGRLRSR